MRKFVAILFVAALVAAAPAGAQDKPLDVNIGGGYTFALSDVGKYLGDGWNVNLGIAYNVSEIVSIQAEYSFNGLGQKQIDLPVSATPIAGGLNQPFYADMNMQNGTLNLIIKAPVEGNLKPYVVAGGGIYYRPVKVTTPAVGYIPGYCNPWWYVCVPGGYVPVEAVLGSRSATDFGVDFGGGVNVQLGDRGSLYVEARYHYIWGPEVATSASGTTQKANGKFLPITVGLRF